MTLHLTNSSMCATIGQLFNLHGVPDDCTLLDLGIPQNDTMKLRGELKRVFGKDVPVTLNDTAVTLMDKIYVAP